MIPIINSNLKEICEKYTNAVINELNSLNEEKRAVIDEYINDVGKITSVSNLSIEELVSADFKTLNSIVQKYDKSDKISNEPAENELKGLYGRFSKASSKFGKTKLMKAFNAVNLIESLGLTVCPYCNRNYINNIKRDKENSIIRSSQLDHFFDKASYAFLAVSFYNLVPSCQSCNHTKGNEALGISPYDTDFNLSEAIKIKCDYETLPANADEVKIVFKYDNNEEEKKERISKYLHTLGLENQYELHKNEAYEIIMRKHIYSEEMKDEILDSYPGLFKDKKEIEAILYGSYMNPEMIANRPLGKLCHDIYSNEGDTAKSIVDKLI